MPINDDVTSVWPSLSHDAWHETAATLHLWLQIVGKIQLVQCAWINHSWHAALQLTARGMGTRLIRHGRVSFQIEFDFIDHQLLVRVSDGGIARLPLEPQTTAAFYRKVMNSLDKLGVPTSIHTTPNELPNPISFDVDEVHASYDAGCVHRYWRILMQTARVFDEFRTRFIGKCSPVHFFWGSADLAVTRFSGRVAPPHPGGVPYLPDWVAREAYSHEVSSAGFWAGDAQHPNPIFYSYAYPEPHGYAQAAVRPRAAHYDSALREFVLPYDDVRTADSPDAALLEFLQSSYEAAADRGMWNRPALEPGAGWPRERDPAHL